VAALAAIEARLGAERIAGLAAALSERIAAAPAAPPRRLPTA